MSAPQENFTLPGVNLGHRQPKKKRRSSILKTAKPFEDIQNVVHGDERVLKDRRVSFCNTVEIKEFLKELPSHTRQPALMRKPQKPEELLLEPHGEIRKVELAAEDPSFIQISTPVGQKRRRVSFLSGAKIERFSIIPKLEKSDDDDDHFEPFADLEDDPLEHSGATAKKEDITLIEQLPEPEAGFPENDLFSTQGDHQVHVDHLACPFMPMVVPPHELTREQEASDMDLTCNEVSLLDAEELLKQWQGDEHAGAKNPSKAKNPSEMQPESDMSFTCVDSMPVHAQATVSEAHKPQEKKPGGETYFDAVPTEVQPSPRICQNRISEAQPDSKMNVGTFPTRSHYAGINQVSRDEGSEMSLCTEIEEDITAAVQPQSIICDDRMQLTAVQLQGIEGAVTGVKAPNTRPTRPQMPVNRTRKTTEPILFQACKTTETVCEASDGVNATIEQEIPGSNYSSMESTKSIPKPDQTASPTAQARIQKSTETMYEASMSLTCIDTGVSDATIEQEIPGLKSTNTEATKSIPKPDETSKLESPIEQIEVQSESDILHVASEPVVQHTASDISSTVPPNVVDRVPPADTSRKEASLPAVSNDSTSACPNLQPANNHLSSLSTDGLFKQPQLPLKLAKHNMSKSKLVIQPVITSSPALRTPHCTPMTLPPPGSKNLPAAQFPQIMTPGSILSKNVRPGGVTPSRQHTAGSSPESTKTGAYVEGNAEGNEEKCYPGDAESNTALSITHPSLPSPAQHLSELHEFPEESISTNHIRDHHHQSSSSRDRVCASWLHSMAEDSFSLVGTSLESDPSLDATEDRAANTDTAACTQDEREGHKTTSFLQRSQMQSKHSVHREAVSTTGSSLPLLKKTVENLKDEENQGKDTTMQVDTPEAIPVKQSDLMRDVFPTLDVTAAEVSQASLLAPLGQSVRMSPSAFTKFLGALECDKSVNENSFYASPVQLVEGSADDTPATAKPFEPITSPEVEPQEYFLQPPSKLSKREIHESSECETSLIPNDHTCSQNDVEDYEQEEPSVVKPDKHAANTTFILKEQRPLQESSGVQITSMVSECTPNENTDGSHVNHTHRSPQPFGAHSQDLHNRLSAAAKEIQLRLSSAEYLKSDSRIEATLTCWLQVLNMYLCSLNTVIQFGSLSGLSVSHLCDVPQLVSCPPVSRGDMTGSRLQKAQWVLEMIQWIQELHPIVQATLNEAASLYPWEIVTWSEEEVEVEVQSLSALKLKLKLTKNNPQQIGGFIQEITDIYMYTDSKQGSWIDCKRNATIDQCRYTTDIADMLWQLSTEDFHQPVL